MNSTHPIADDYSIDLTELRNGQSVDSRILTDLQEMFDAARSEDIYPIVSDAYRTREEQQELMDDTIRIMRMKAILQKKRQVRLNR